VGGPGGAVRQRPAPATAAAGKTPASRAVSGNARQGRRPRGTREVWWQLDGDRWTGRARSPSSPHGGRRRREAAGGEGLARRGRSSGRPLFMVDMRSRPATTCAPALTRRTACP
jgi:hypothetical protein